MRPITRAASPARRPAPLLAALALGALACVTTPAATPRSGTPAGNQAAPAAPATAAPPAAPPLAEPLRARIEARIAQLPGARVGLYYAPLGGAPILARNADSSFHAASTMKVPVMLELYRRAERGALSLDATMPLVNRFASIVDGTPYQLSAGDDSDSSLYAKVGTPVRYRELIERMITRSSNLATNAMIDAAGGGEAITATARALGAARIEVRRGVEDTKAFRAGLNNTTTARDLGVLLDAIAGGRAAGPTATREMLGVLERQEFNECIPAGLPAGTRVAHKTGSITATLHDAAVVYPPDAPPYVLVVLTGGIPDQKAAQQLIADLSREVWFHATAARR